jgi:hypothetical protein
MSPESSARRNDHHDPFQAIIRSVPNSDLVSLVCSLVDIQIIQERIASSTSTRVDMLRLKTFMRINHPLLPVQPMEISSCLEPEVGFHKQKKRVHIPQGAATLQALI